MKLKPHATICPVFSSTALSPPLQTIREVTGYVLIGMNKVEDIPLHQLRVIRGNTLYDKHFALSILFNYPKDGSTGLRHLGLTHLTGQL